MPAAAQQLDPTRSTASTVRGSIALRISVAALAAIGFVLSYDALRQMAVAVHIRGPLTYLFPLVIDGFIAIGVAALIILRAGPTGSRIYIWALVFTATGTSIWANALHAVRLNHLETGRSDELHLGDLSVALLSTVAPLALAGAVHLYILISRNTPTRTPNDGPGLPHAAAEPALSAVSATGTPVLNPAGSAGPNGTPTTERPTIASDPLASDRRSETADRHTAADTSISAPPPHPAPAQPTQRRTGRPPGAEFGQLLAIAREAVESHGETSRTVVENAIRDQGLPIGGERLTKIMKVLKSDADTTSDRPSHDPQTTMAAAASRSTSEEPSRSPLHAVPPIQAPPTHT
ncbi:DUF2637 domain-containing protein [Streptomyces sp. CMB-StM0423]|uniref:DUF2637 domain-containing protein n=1 Tax=Streptomyces sp. CMB-StM0423 TaxID=2059884 RepID=UPI000C70EC02|nr:DUF2637 domain-containing protein [Streptomyces sp. CMB-StM0423]AUH42207.1 hypothetical protein CXR04_20160 [Streptomyces sp. CMB-StM0423]